MKINVLLNLQYDINIQINITIWSIYVQAKITSYVSTPFEQLKPILATIQITNVSNKEHYKWPHSI